MGDRNYYSNQFNPFMGQNYGYSQSQQQPMPYYRNMPPPQDGGFSVNTSMPVYNTAGAPFSQAQSSTNHPVTGSGPQQFQDDNPPPSYLDSRCDRLLSRSNTNNRYSPAWNYIGDRGKTTQNSQNKSFSNLFDIPGQTRVAIKSPDWSSDNYNSSQTFQEEPQGRFNPQNSFSQQPTTNFSSDYRNSSDYRFSEFNQRGFGKNKQNRGKGRGGFRGRGNWQNRGRQGNMKFDQGGGGEGYVDDGDNGGGGAAPEKVNAFIPDSSLVQKYQYYPPSAEEMGEMFKDLVIFFFWKVSKNKKEKNPFVLICEAFRRSTGYCNLEVEDGYCIQMKHIKFTTLRYRGMMLVRGVGENNNLKEPRVLAGVELINKLAMSCYTLESKQEYYGVRAFEEMLKVGSVPGVYIIVPEEETSDFHAARNYLKLEFAKGDSDVEYLIHISDMKNLMRLKSWANHLQNKCEVRMIKDEWIGVCRQRTPQYWRDKILASGSMETERFILKTPIGIGNQLIQNVDIKDLVSSLKAHPLTTEPSLPHIYGPPGIGPEISTALPPWDRDRGGSRKGLKRKQKERKIMEEIKKGVPVTAVKGFKYLSKHKKNVFKKKLGIKSWA